MPGMRSTVTAGAAAPAVPAQQLRLGVDPAPRAVGGRAPRRASRRSAPAAVAVDAAGAGIDQRRTRPPAPARAAAAACAGRARRCGGGGARCSTCIGQGAEPAERGRVVQVAQQRQRAGRPQREGAGDGLSASTRQRPRSRRSTRCRHRRSRRSAAGAALKRRRSAEPWGPWDGAGHRAEWGKVYGTIAAQFTARLALP
jgi:hypothetical protein